MTLEEFAEEVDACDDCGDIYLCWLCTEHTALARAIGAEQAEDSVRKGEW